METLPNCLDFYPYNAPKPKDLPGTPVSITLPGDTLLIIREYLLDLALTLEGESLVSKGWLQDHKLILAQLDKALWPETP